MFWRLIRIWILKYNYLLLIIIALVVLSFLTDFLYDNFYKTIGQTDKITLLQKEVALDVIDTGLFEKVQQGIINKKAGNPAFLTPSETKWLNLKNPFLPYTVEQPIISQPAINPPAAQPPVVQPPAIQPLPATNQ